MFDDYGEAAIDMNNQLTKISKQSLMYRTYETGCSQQQTRDKVLLHQEEEGGPGQETDEPVSGYEMTLWW